jgi:hypothetical protein
MSGATNERARSEAGEWPELAFERWRETGELLHMLTQIVGKIRLARLPLINHWWQVTLYPSARGMATGVMPCAGSEFEIEFDFLRHEIVITRDDGEARRVKLTGRPVAEYYREIMGALAELDLDVRIWPVPMEVADPIRFDRDTKQRRYEPEAAERLWRALLASERVMTRFRSRFIGKVSPIHFFWGGFDLAVTRFSGRRAPEHGPVPNTPQFVVTEAYSHEVSSAGFWPGAAGFPQAVFYSYAYAEPKGFGEAKVAPKEAYYNKDFGEFMLPYEAVRTAASPDAALLDFLQSTYEAAADCGKWDRGALERQVGI